MATTSEASPALDDFHAWMGVALEEGAAALAEREVPVGCVFVGHDGRVLVREHNRTNATFNPTRHAEMVALDHLLKLQRRDMRGAIQKACSRSRARGMSHKRGAVGPRWP